MDIAFYHPQLGETVQYTNGSKEEGSHTASIVKVVFLLGMLEKYGVEGTLTAADRTYLTNMIEHSSNEATTYLEKNRLGGQSGLEALFRQLTMEDTHASVAWGISKGASQFAVKNGWLSIYSDSWIVNSIGQIYGKKVSQGDYLLAVLTKGEESQQSAIDLIEDLAELTRENLPKSVDKKKTDSLKKAK